MARMTKLQKVASDFVARRTYASHAANTSGALHNMLLFAMSYNTVIARHDGEGNIKLNTQRYSVTTSKHQSAIRYAASVAGVPVIETDGEV